jgi:hypothetical protein
VALVGFAAAATATAVAAALLTAPTSHADVAGPYFANPDGLGSDPHMIPCTDPDTNTNGWCLYTSLDMGEDDRYEDNWYPMEETKAYFSANGYSDWDARDTVFDEDTLEDADLVPTNAYHLWAPSAVKNGSYYYLYVPDVSDTSPSDDPPPNISTSSFISVSRSTSPFGPFTLLGTIEGGFDYMSDPDVVVDGQTRVIIWANGDYSTCGGFTTGLLGTDMQTIVSQSTQSVSINGISVLGDCDDNANNGIEPYVEGASLYKVGTNKWEMYFAAKPESVPTECAAAVNPPDAADTDNSVIARATASSPQGPYTYKGIVMCGSTTEWTNQATVQTVSNGRKIIVYHDSPASIKERSLHAECLFTNGDIVAGVYRQPLDADAGFNDCMAGTYDDYVGLHMKDPQYPAMPPIIRAPKEGWDLRADRYAVGKYERYWPVSLGWNAYAFKALSNGKYLCTTGSTVAVTASCTNINEANGGAIWQKVAVTGGYVLKSAIIFNKYLSVAGNGRLYVSATSTADAAIINNLHPGG